MSEAPVTPSTLIEAMRSQEASLRAVAAELRTPLQAARVLTELARRQCEAGVVPDAFVFEKLDEQFERFHDLLRRLTFGYRAGSDGELDVRGEDAVHGVPRPIESSRVHEPTRIDARGPRTARFLKSEPYRGRG